MKRVAFSLGNGLMLGLFLAAAAVQYNDPDAAVWMAIYGAGALCCALYTADRLPRLLAGVVSGVGLLWALFLLLRLLGPVAFFDETEMMGLVEETREMFGLLITASWTGVLAWRVHRAASSPREAPA